MPDHVLDDTLWAAEIKLEREARSEGIARYRRNVEEAIGRGDGASLKASERLLVHWFPALRALIAQEKKDIEAGKHAMNRGKYGPVLLKFNTARLALATMHEVMGFLLQEPVGVAPIKLCLAIARALNGEMNYRQIRTAYNAGLRVHKKEHPDERYIHPAWDALVHTSRRRITPRNTNKVSERFTPGTRWPIRLQAQIGACLLELLDKVATMDAYSKPFVSAFHKHKVWHKGHAQWRWRLSDTAREKIADGHDFRENLTPQYMPMVAPPLPWTDKAMGGYATLPTAMVKKYERHASEPVENEQIREAVNYLNSTPWRVNQWILGIVEELAAAGGNIAGISHLNPLPFPPRPADFDDKESPNRKAWKKHAAWLIRRNCELSSQARVFAIKLAVAKRMVNFERFYFPHQLDFRTRLYPIPVLFNHQGDDVARGLLEFADGRDCTSVPAQRWLRTHLANRCGVDKVSFADRIAWVESNMDAFSGWVDKPLLNTGWMEADDPFQALAAARALLHPEDGAFLPVQIDGSNNALQHYAAMIRCPVAAQMVNVIPSDTPQDFYGVVAGLVEAEVGRDADKGSELARRLDNMIDRKLVKTTAMTNYYGVTAVGARRQMHESLKEAGFDERQQYPASKYLSKLVMHCTERAGPSVQKALEWLRACATLICKSGRTVQWTSPMGMLIEQPYRNSKRFQVRTPFAALYPSRIDDTCPVKTQKQVNAFAPNFVHPIDASHFMCTVLACMDKGITFSGVHDSDWTHAATMDACAALGREQFVLIHEQPLLDRLANELAGTYPALAFPPAPPLGTLDINQALHSSYLFA